MAAQRLMKDKSVLSRLHCYVHCFVYIFYSVLFCKVITKQTHELIHALINNNTFINTLARTQYFNKYCPFLFLICTIWTQTAWDRQGRGSAGTCVSQGRGQRSNNASERGRRPLGGWAHIIMTNEWRQWTPECCTRLLYDWKLDESKLRVAQTHHHGPPVYIQFGGREWWAATCLLTSKGAGKAASSLVCLCNTLRGRWVDDKAGDHVTRCVLDDNSVPALVVRAAVSFSLSFFCFECEGRDNLCIYFESELEFLFESKKEPLTNAEGAEKQSFSKVWQEKIIDKHRMWKIPVQFESLLIWVDARESEFSRWQRAALQDYWRRGRGSSICR